MQSTKKQDIEKLVLKSDILDMIKKDGELFIQVAKVLGVSHFTLPDLIRKNDHRLTQTSVVRLLKTAMKTNDENVILEPEKATA